MAYFNNFEFSKLRAKRHAEKVKQKQEIYEIKHSNDGEKKKISYGKALVAFIFVDCLAIQMFIMMMIYRYADTSQLSSLMGLIGTLFIQGVSLISYNVKSSKENSSGGIVYQNMMNEYAKQNTMADDETESVG